MSNRDTILKLLLTELQAILRRELPECAASQGLRELGVNSLDLVELIVVVEQRFQIQLMESGLGRDDFGSLEAIAAAIARLQNQQ